MRTRASARVRYSIRSRTLTDGWRALGNEYWPAVYVVDKEGRIRTSLFGEIHIGTDRDREVTTLVDKLLAETMDAPK